MSDLSVLEASLGMVFEEKDLLTQALTHRSYLNENPSFHLGHNERLEFLGDAVIELVVTEYLYKHYEEPEGDLTNWRASLVNAKMLSEVCRELAVEPHLLLSRGEAKETGKARQFILANAFEAIVGALYLDQGMRASRTFLKRVLLPKLPHILKHKLYIDAKSRFQEIAQDRLGVTPSYKVLGETGPDHAKQFVVGIYIGNELIAKGQGLSKQEGQMDAAEKALKVKGWV
ncbi:ribonuclease III [Candidatus Uhrbacteria bacterium]|nr:ribonuclease III [Candidatus Uhrbacteria bacterium]